MSSTLSNYLTEQAGWREAKAEQYPTDERNQRSADALKSLAAYVDSDDCGNKTAVWFLGILEHDGQVRFGEEGQRLISRYGFDSEVIESKQHDAFLADLQRVAADDTYKFAASEIEGWPEGVRLADQTEKMPAPVRSGHTLVAA